MNRLVAALLLLVVLNHLFPWSHALTLKHPSLVQRPLVVSSKLLSNANNNNININNRIGQQKRGGFVSSPRGLSTTTTRMSFMLFAVDPNSVLDTIMSSTMVSSLLADGAGAANEDTMVSYSKASYYTILALYLISLPGLWSTIQRTTKVKVLNKTYISPGAQSSSSSSNLGGAVGKTLRQEAAEIMAYMKANNYVVKDAGETITFEGIVQRSVSQAAFLTFVTALGMASLALVLQIQFNDLVLPWIGKPNWYYLALLSPYAGIYYWKSGDRVDQCSVKLQTNEEETENEIVVQGSEEELDRMWRTLGWREKGMVKVEGLLKQYQ